MNIDTSTETVGEVVRRDYRAAAVFKSFHIDFCCGGNKSIAQVCAERKLDEQKVLDALRNYLNESPAKGDINFDAWPLDLLIDYIEKTHHRYVERSIPPLKNYLRKLVAIHGEAQPQLRVIEQLFNASAGNLAQHMKKEELILFPYIRKMVKAALVGEELTPPSFGSVAQPIASMIVEHETEGAHFDQISKESNEFDVPGWGCNTYAVAMKLLQEFQEDLHLHIHLENNILFPKAAELEKRLKKAQPETDHIENSSCAL